MNYTNKDLIKRIEELEKQLKERPTKEEVYRDLRKDLASYDDRVKTEKEIIFKNNAYIKNRKGLFKWSDNVLSLGFNKTDPDKLNQIQIGLDRDDTTGERIRETNTVFLAARSRQDANLDLSGLTEQEKGAVRASNGLVTIQTQRENKDYGGIQIGERGTLIGDKEGVASMLLGGKTNGLAGIGNVIEHGGNDIGAVCFHTEQDSISTGGVYQQKLMQFVDILPSSGGGIVPALGRKSYHYKELVLMSPDGSSFAVRVDNAGALTATKL